MKSMASNLDLKYVQCCAHVINLAVRAALEADPVKQALGSVKRIVSKLNKSAKSKTLFKRLLKEVKLSMILPVSDCPTRWGSTYAMISDVLNSLPAVENFITELKMTPFDTEELRLLEAIQTFLAPFYTMTKQVCCEDSCVSMYIPVGKILIASTKKNCQAAKREAKQFGDLLLSKVRHYFNEWFEDEYLWIAALCDPRFAFLDTRSLISKEKAKIPQKGEQMTQWRGMGGRPVWNLLTDRGGQLDAPCSTRGITEDQIQIEAQQYALLLKNRDHRSRQTHWSGGAATKMNSPLWQTLFRNICLAGIICGNKRRGRLSGENARLLLMLKANSNEKIGKLSKAWNMSKAKRYGRTRAMEQIFNEET
ncbi:hypothetical protein OESDEN_12384, partial [Oesophagostomum dentatum]